MADSAQQSDLSFILNDLNARIRVLEEKYTLFGERILIINKNMIEEYKKTIRGMKNMETELKDLKNDIVHIKDILKDITKEMSLFAKKDSLKVLEKYINLWNPMKFVTEEEVIRLIKRENLKNG